LKETLTRRCPQFALLKTSDTPAAVKAVFVDDTVDEATNQLKAQWL